MKKIKGHQGDVIFAQVNQLPNNAKKISNRPIALGEKSGHQHILTGDVEMYEVEGSVFASVGRNGALLQHVHQSNVNESCLTELGVLPQADHLHHSLPSGVYQFWIQNQYNPYSKIMERVID